MSLEQKTNAHLHDLVRNLRRLSWQNEAPIWRDIAKRLERSAQNWPHINLSRLEYHLDADTMVVVPGKLLGAGTLTKAFTVGAFNFTRSARRKIEAAGGKCLTLAEMAEAHPKGTSLHLMG